LIQFQSSLVAFAIGMTVLAREATSDPEMRADLKYPLVLAHFVLYYTQMQEMDEAMTIALREFVELSKEIGRAHV
jgi:hypothetical protein